jgi:transcriptional regulator with XRE-family HTH domain
MDPMRDPPPAGALLRRWRRYRRLSQLGLALKANVSQRHLSFVETGRARPSRDMVLQLAEHLQLPLRERNRLLLASGYAPIYTERPLDDPALTPVRNAIELVLRGHQPYPAIAIDRHWQLVAANDAATQLLAGSTPALIEPPINVLRFSLHPDGLAPRIANLSEWRDHLLERLQRQIDATADPVLASLLEELRGYPTARASRLVAPDPAPREPAVFVPLELATPYGTLLLISTTTVFGTPADVTVAELALECFFPADETTAAALHRMAAALDGT